MTLSLSLAHSAFFVFCLFCDKGYGYQGNGLGPGMILQAGVKPGAQQQERHKGNLLVLLHNSSHRIRVGRRQPLGRGCWEMLTDKPPRILTVPTSERVCVCIRTSQHVLASMKQMKEGRANPE